MNKIYTIYHIPKYVYSDGSIGKIGVSYRLTSRMKENLKKSVEGFTNWEVLEEHKDVYKVSDREIELQKQYGYKVDTTPYWKTLEVATYGGSSKGGKIAANKNIESGHMQRIKGLGAKSCIKNKKGMFSPENIAKRIEANKKAVLQYSKDGNFIREWESQKQAGIKLVIDLGQINRACKGKSKTAGGFIFKYKED